MDGHPFDQMLLGSRKGHYFVYIEFIRRAVGKNLGDTLSVTLEKNDAVRVLKIPSEIELAKKEETRLNRLQKRIQYLSDQ